MGMEDAVILAQLLGACDRMDQALKLFGTVRQPMCRFVQDASRAVGEAGANENIHSLEVRNQAFAETAQSKVDGFYGLLDTFQAEAAARIIGKL